jgi:hypothetical protein
LCLFLKKKLVIKAEENLPGTERGKGERVGGGQGGIMTQTTNAHVNKRIIKFLKIKKTER